MLVSEQLFNDISVSFLINFEIELTKLLELSDYIDVGIDVMSSLLFVIV